MKNLIQISAFIIGATLLLSGNAVAERKKYSHDEVKDVIYTLTNEVDGNAVLAFDHLGHGKIRPAGRFETGGTGTGAGLGNQGALALTENGRFLFAVNPGSHDISVFRVLLRGGLKLIDQAEQEGMMPVSIAVSYNRVYVVNAGDDSIYGFRFYPRLGQLRPLPHSHQALSADATAPAQISFNRSGDTLVVTEKATNKITIFSLNEWGMPVERHSIDSAGVTPFGFAFGKRDQFFVSEAQGGAADAATVSSYRLLNNGSAELINGAVAVGQTAACWLATTPNGRIAFTANTPAGTISSFAIDRAGNLTLLDPVAAEESGPRDLAMSEDGKTLFSVSGGDNSIGIYRVRRGGELKKLPGIGNLPPAFTGLAIR